MATANTILENIKIDIPTVFGANSPEANEVATNPSQAFADFVGIGIHCAAGAGLCSSDNNGRPDLLPDEPGGYSGFQGLVGHKYVVAQLGQEPLTDLNGNVIQDPAGHIGFPGFDGMTAAVSLSYVAAMQEHGVPVTTAYISDAHDNHPTGPAFGPGQAGYVAHLKAYDSAFATFFNRPANDGINQNNTLFVFTSDEGDHFVGAPPTPAGCDGVNTPCSYSQIGEVNVNAPGLLATQAGITTPFKMHNDVAPTFYITGNPGPADPVTRSFERGVGALTATNPYTGVNENLTEALADPVEMKLLHMITADPARTPTFTMFAKPDYFLLGGAPSCGSAVCIKPAFAWNHGTFSSDITTSWLGLVGPGVRHIGQTGDIWSDHTDIRPTLLSLVGLTDDYAHQGRALFEVFQAGALLQGLRTNTSAVLQLAQAYTQINAPVGQLGLASLSLSTQALQSGSASDDSTYSQIEAQLAQFATQRDALANQIAALLDAATFSGQPISQQQAQSLTNQANDLLSQVKEAAGGS